MNNDLPLAGIRVLDLTSVWAMPYACGMLTDYGAEVIKIEALQRLDTTRNAGTYADQDSGPYPWNAPGTFSVINRGKRSLMLNMADERGRELFRELVKTADIVVENFTARVMRNWKLDYEHLKELRPDIIMVSNTGYGHGGPWESYPVQGTALEATTGIPNYTGYVGGRPWTAVQSYPDFVACWHGLFGIMSALRRREVTGQGQWIDCGMYAANVSMIGEGILDYVANGRLGERIGNRDYINGVQGVYQTQGDDQWMAVTAATDAEWLALRNVVGDQLWGTGKPPATLAEARSRHDEVDAVLTAWAVTQTREGSVETMRAAGLASGPVNDARDLFLDPQIKERGLYELVLQAPESNAGIRPVIGRAFHASETKFKVQRPAPPLGEGNEYVLKEILGLSDSEFADLEADKLTGKKPPVEPETGLPIDALLGVRRIRIHDADYKKVIGLV
ncbi:MAG: CoA transferase [Chloroflexota bacterium]